MIVLGALLLVVAFLSGFWTAVARRNRALASAPAAQLFAPASPDAVALEAVGHVPAPSPQGPEWQVQIWNGAAKAAQHAATDDHLAALRGYNASYTAGHTIKLVNLHTGQVRLERTV